MIEGAVKLGEKGEEGILGVDAVEMSVGSLGSHWDSPQAGAGGRSPGFDCMGAYGLLIAMASVGRLRKEVFVVTARGVTRDGALLRFLGMASVPVRLPDLGACWLAWKGAVPDGLIAMLPDASTWGVMIVVAWYGLL